MDLEHPASTVTVHPLSGRPLRYLLTLHLFSVGPRSLSELVAFVEQAGYPIAGRPSKTVSDALRWEIRRGRVVRLGRGYYGVGTMPRQTKSWMRRRARQLLEDYGSPGGPGDRAA